MNPAPVLKSHCKFFFFFFKSWSLWDGSRDGTLNLLSQRAPLWRVKSKPSQRHGTPGESHRRLHTEVEAQQDAHRGFLGYMRKASWWVCVCECVCQECSIPPSLVFSLPQLHSKWLKLKEMGILPCVYFCVCACVRASVHACMLHGRGCKPCRK